MKRRGNELGWDLRPCEGCGRQQAAFLSEPDTRTVKAAGCGLILCVGCHEKGTSMPVEDAVLFYTRAKGETP